VKEYTIIYTIYDDVYDKYIFVNEGETIQDAFNRQYRKSSSARIIYAFPGRLKSEVEGGYYD